MLTYNGSALRVNGGTVDYIEPVSGAVIGGKTYPTVTMPDGNEWLAVNLDYAWTGLSVPTSGASESANPQAMYYNYDETTYGWNGYKCGLLYNWYAVNYLEQNKSTLCPGWHVPTSAEWDALVTAAGGASAAGTKLRASNVSWAPSWGGTDDYGFAALPAGEFGGSFSSVGSYSDFWTATDRNVRSAYHLVLRGGSSIEFEDSNKGYQFSVRLVKDST